jgi:hypothetical protein
MLSPSSNCLASSRACSRLSNPPASSRSVVQLSHELVPKVEVDRARNFVADLAQQATSAREAWRVQGANLAQLLRLDPRAVIVPLKHNHF